MIYKNYENSKLKNVLAMCDCGCSGFNFKLFDDTVFISTYGDNFYSFQRPGRINRRALFRKLTKKENVLQDVILTKEDVKELIEALKSFEFTPDDDDTYENVSHLVLSPITWDDNFVEYELLLIYDGSLASIVKHKTYRGFEIALKENEFKEFVKEMEKEYENQDGLCNK